MVYALGRAQGLLREGPTGSSMFVLWRVFPSDCIHR